MTVLMAQLQILFQSKRQNLPNQFPSQTFFTPANYPNTNSPKLGPKQDPSSSREKPYFYQQNRSPQKTLLSATNRSPQNLSCQIPLIPKFPLQNRYAFSPKSSRLKISAKSIAPQGLREKLPN
jgi:hypothetical protein